MAISTMSLSLFPRARPLLAPLAILAALALGGCVVAPAYGPGVYRGGYYAPGYAYAPAPVVVGGGWYGGGWYGGGYHHGRGW